MLTCAPTCPALADATATQRADALFFSENADATEFVRSASWPERSMLIAGGMSPDVARATRVRVTQVWPGFRVKQPLTPGQVTR
jgi:hypothetical protein